MYTRRSYNKSQYHSAYIIPSVVSLPSPFIKPGVNTYKADATLALNDGDTVDKIIVGSYSATPVTTKPTISSLNTAKIVQYGTTVPPSFNLNYSLYDPLITVDILIPFNTGSLSACTLFSWNIDSSPFLRAKIDNTGTLLCNFPFDPNTNVTIGTLSPSTWYWLQVRSVKNEDKYSVVVYDLSGAVIYSVDRTYAFLIGTPGTPDMDLPVIPSGAFGTIYLLPLNNYTTQQCDLIIANGV